MAPAGIGADLEGLHAVQAALQAGRLTELRVEGARMSNPEVAVLIEQARTAGVRIEVVDDVRPFAVTAVPQGLVGRARPLMTYSLDALTEPAPCALVVLDHLEDPHNVGAIARSALAAGATGLVVPTRRAAPIGPTAFKVGAGAFEHLRVSVQSSTADVVQRLKRLGVWTVGLTTGGGERLFGLALLTEPVAIVVGGEGQGLGRLVEERVDVSVRIPMAIGSESLNASVAAALAVFEVARVRNEL
ncbi:MAG TPA: RNA methyltransferase [Acidimicrobiia bacterium]|jgi:23S rRNA (guanosine2251-2'-O)-methyltransferase|nr:RNA methyltransferase [Acidimicrobiia bacterium]